MSDVVVIGAGLSGLAAACHLTGAGHRVTVLERADHPGGRAGRLQQDGFTFDTGPTVFTMPGLVDDALGALGTCLSDRVRLERLDPAYRARFADGSTIHVRHGHEAMRAEIADQCGAHDAAAFDGFVAWLRELYQVELPHFIDRNYETPLSLLSGPRAVARLLRLGAFGRLGDKVRDTFDDERLQRLFSFQAMYAGLAPDRALAIYAVITYMDSIAGVWFPAGGIRSIPQAMADALTEAGSELRYGAEVGSILRRSDGAVCGVELADGSRTMADAVVCTLDLPIAYRDLLPGVGEPRARRRAQFSPSAVVWHVGVHGEPGPEVAHHNIHFGASWGDAFDDLLDRGVRMRDPSRLVSFPSLHDASAAPADCSTLYVLEPVPNLAIGQIDWASERMTMRAELLAFLHGQGYPTDVITEELVTPDDWLGRGMAAGTPFALAHTFGQTGPFRPANHAKKVPGLVFAGSGTVPGVGVPMVLISGKLAAQRVEAYLR
jgi:phytoene desaturase